MDSSNLLKSPCFVHSHLSKSASLKDWLHEKESEVLRSDVGIARSLQQPHEPRHHIDEGDPDRGSSSLTKQLGETALGVREMMKQLGRARIRANVQSVLIVTKARDNRLTKLTRKLALYLMLKPRHGNRGLIVYVDNQLRVSRRFDAAGIQRDHPELFAPFPQKRSPSSNLPSFVPPSASQDDPTAQQGGQLRYWTRDMCSHTPHLFDLVVALGGDGTVLLTSWLFQRSVPPVLPFAFGSLGFLTNFDFADHQAVVDSAIDEGIRVNLRMRLTCTIYRAVVDGGKSRKAVKKIDADETVMNDLREGGWKALEGGWSGGFTTRPLDTFEILNDLVVDRGPSPHVSSLDIFGDEIHMGAVQADGLCVTTVDASTAYPLSAGASLVHPEIPAIIISPLSPDALSFRPMILPDTMELRICVSYKSRSAAWAEFDGRGRVELKQGDHIKITASNHPLPTICADKSIDWFDSISRTLKWNEHQDRTSCVSFREAGSSFGSGSHFIRPPAKASVDGEEEVSEDDDKFDIDDSSAEAATNKNGTTPEVATHTDLEHLSTPMLAALTLAQGRAPSSMSSGLGLRRAVDNPGRLARPTSLVEHHISEFGSDPPSQPFPNLQSPARVPGRRGHYDRIGSEGCANDHQRLRAFAVWGQDEDDSSASDSSL
ncbi:ATP-NAD kinase [Paxillus ammoniavirescens]|nr:ATP-NAD kinase [Paxillus ammoniavirescens]